MLSPFIVVLIYLLIKPLPTETPPDDLLFESGVERHEGGLLNLAISEYDKAIGINRYNLQGHQKRGDAYFANGDLGPRHGRLQRSHKPEVSANQRTRFTEKGRYA